MSAMESFLTASIEGEPDVASTGLVHRHHYIIFTACARFQWFQCNQFFYTLLKRINSAGAGGRLIKA
jgi:hypothetical protein